jgi:hypothetical protein
LAVYAHLVKAHTAQNSKHAANHAPQPPSSQTPSTQTPSNFCPAAYFIVKERTLLTDTQTAFPQGEPVDGPPLTATWNGGVKALEERLAELAAGHVYAPCKLEEAEAEQKAKTEAKAKAEAEAKAQDSAQQDDGKDRTPPKESQLDEQGRLVLKPFCKYCDYASICAGGNDQ